VSLRAVFFDAGETLLHPHPSFPELLSATLSEEGIDASPERIRAKVHVLTDRFHRAAADGELWSTSEARSRAFWGSVYSLLLGELGVTMDDRLAARLYATFTDAANYRLFPDVLPVLEDLRGRGLTLGLVSNFEAWLDGLLEHLGIRTLLDIRVISGEVGLEKPDPEIFRMALARASVLPAASTYVGDNPYFDVEPAVAVGMRGILIDRRDRHPGFPGDRITSLSDLPAALELAS
jgi:putative hydrolase of the HAD superfamily